MPSDYSVNCGLFSPGKRRGFLRADLAAEITARAINVMIFESVEQVTRSKTPHETAERWERSGRHTICT